MDEFYEKLTLVLKNYEEKTHIALVGRLRMKMSRKFSDFKEPETLKQNKGTDEILFHEGKSRMMGIYKIESECPS
jgi:hypothetical protein